MECLPAAKHEASAVVGAAGQFHEVRRAVNGLLAEEAEDSETLDSEKRQKCARGDSGFLHDVETQKATAARLAVRYRPMLSIWYQGPYAQAIRSCISIGLPCGPPCEKF